ncbi:CPBP family intramembrane glutamic endopeptidase [Corynebacterium epidermidicanis]|uniref:CAAX protease self-immunity n=1 Tax=Corynebacterium epidermidicanis TaxID=1050174 RepID=A0A0G3GQF6_9CORY|nr:CPBP family intramembrane glutamic endopeptidase [Corynebacterium epidermidicanis]AKK03436.1 CAAX protease self-immunity [Corynebacterium epidermidicanis]
MSYFIQAHRRWWQPLLEILLVLLFWPIFVGLSLGGVELVAWTVGQGGFVDRGLVEPMDMNQVESSMALLLMLAAGVPAVLLAARIVRGRNWRSVLGVHGFSWRHFGLGIAVVLPMALCFVSTMYLIGPPRSVAVNWPLLLVCSLFVPLQSIAEELVFRGVLAQAVGKWTRSWIVALIAPMPLFVLGHDYSWAGLMSIAWFALCAGYLAHRTGGLAAPMAFHVANNLGYFWFGAIGLMDLNAVDVSVPEALIDVLFCTLATWAVLSIERRLQPKTVVRSTLDGR